MSKRNEIITWYLSAHTLDRLTNGWGGKPIYEISSKWSTKLNIFSKVQEKWEHKRFKDIDEALQYYDELSKEQL